MKLRVCTMFSGYDSQCMALDRLKEMHPEFDYELVAWAEIDKFAIMAHNAVYPQWSDRNYGDVSKIDWNQVPDFDLLTYSSPCQDFSQAGKQAGGEEGSGTRSSLLWEVRRAILTKKPKYLLMENVAALVSQKFIRLFNAWQLELSKYGYTNFSQVLNAKNYGVPQNRERIFMVSVLNCTEGYYFPTPIPLDKRLKDVLEKEVDERYYLHDSKDKRLAQIVTEQCNKIQPGDMLDTYSQKILHDTSATILCGIDSRRHHFVAVEPKCQVVGTLPYKSGYENTARVYAAEGLAPSIQSTDGGNTQPKVVEPMIGAFRGRNTENPSERGRINGMYKQRLEINENGTRNTLTGVQKDNMVVEPMIYDDYNQRMREDQDTCGTLTTNCGNDAPRNGFKVIEPQETYYRIRKLTERECFRLMGVRDEDSDKIRAAVSKSQCYKLAGNSIVVDVMVRIFDQLLFGNKNKNQQLEIF